jgi:hypothetical protein
LIKKHFIKEYLQAKEKANYLVLDLFQENLFLKNKQNPGSRKIISVALLKAQFVIMFFFFYKAEL